MRVFLVFPMANGQTGPAIKHAFEWLGHKVKAIDARLQTNKIYESYCESGGDLVFCTKTPEVTEQIRQIKQEFNPVVCMWNPDTRKNIENWKGLFPLINICDYHFVVNYNQIPEWKKLNPNTFWLPQGLQNEVYDKPKNMTSTDIKKYSCDISFCGNLAGKHHKFRDKYLIPVKKTGINFKHWTGIYNEEHNKMVALSKINLGCSAYPENGKCVSVRDYKIMGAGGFLLELYRNDLHEIFPSNILDYYKNTKDIVTKINYWLGHEKERKEVAGIGYKWVHGNATYTDRIRDALEYMKESLC